MTIGMCLRLLAAKRHTLRDKTNNERMNEHEPRMRNKPRHDVMYTIVIAPHSTQYSQYTHTHALSAHRFTPRLAFMDFLCKSVVLPVH